MPRKKKPPVSFEGVVIQEVDDLDGVMVTFIGDPRGDANPSAVEFGGQTFPLGEPVTVTDPQWIKTIGAKLRANSHFEVG